MVPLSTDKPARSHSDLAARATALGSPRTSSHRPREPIGGAASSTRWEAPNPSLVRLQQHLEALGKAVTAEVRPEERKRAKQLPMRVLVPAQRRAAQVAPAAAGDADAGAPNGAFKVAAHLLIGGFVTLVNAVFAKGKFSCGGNGDQTVVEDRVARVLQSIYDLVRQLAGPHGQGLPQEQQGKILAAVAQARDDVAKSGAKSVRESPLLASQFRRVEDVTRGAGAKPVVVSPAAPASRRSRV